MLVSATVVLPRFTAKQHESQTCFKSQQSLGIPVAWSSKAGQVSGGENSKWLFSMKMMRGHRKVCSHNLYIDITIIQ